MTASSGATGACRNKHCEHFNNEHNTYTCKAYMDAGKLGRSVRRAIMGLISGRFVENVKITPGWGPRWIY